MTDARPAAPFLTAEWRWLAMLNYEVDPALLRPLVPAGTELDAWGGVTYASVVGFMFLDTRVLGIPIPFHRDFEELNLRFYVRRKGPEGWRRGVVFIKEIVPRFAIAAVARVVYNENYVALPMRHRLGIDVQTGGMVEYGWRLRGRWCGVRATVRGPAGRLAEGSEEEFITEHYWGYARQRDGGTVEYQVEHPRWNVWRAESSSLDCDVAALYGPAFAEPLSAPPRSALVADGSAIVVRKGRRMDPGGPHPLA
ncbi:MAG TPA: DUF2071 domain-containing protein [Longimicrobium sp.]|nr:DUF2071 domain-containing protein [Longimicrobium sp.]